MASTPRHLDPRPPPFHLNERANLLTPDLETYPEEDLEMDLLRVAPADEVSPEALRPSFPSADVEEGRRRYSREEMPAADSDEATTTSSDEDASEEDGESSSSSSCRRDLLEACRPRGAAESSSSLGRPRDASGRRARQVIECL